MEQRRRDAVLELYCAGKGPKAIISLLKYPKSTVYDIIKRYKEEGLVDRKEHNPRSDKKRTPTFIANLNRSIKSNPGTPITELARRRNVSRTTISKAITLDLGYRSYTLRVRHLLTEAQKETRVIRAKALLSDIKGKSARHVRWFSDEKLFTVDRSCNRQNTRWICKDPADVPMVFRTKNPAAVMVLGVISSEGHVMPPHFFSVGLKINAEVYLAVMKDVVVPWINRVMDGGIWTWQQDGAPAHRAKKVQAWLSGAVPHFWAANL